ncbi:unnamed protein product [Urochloa humidicola]
MFIHHLHLTCKIRYLRAPLLAVQTKPNKAPAPIPFAAFKRACPQPHSQKLRATSHYRAPPKMHRQHSLSASPKQQQGDGIGIGIGGDAAQAMAFTEDESASHSKAADRARSAREERAIHLIPLLTFLCFLLLFLCSHDPSASDMSSFAGAGGVRSGNRRLRML